MNYEQRIWRFARERGTTNYDHVARELRIARSCIALAVKRMVRKGRAKRCGCAMFDALGPLPPPEGRGGARITPGGFRKMGLIDGALLRYDG